MNYKSRYIDGRCTIIKNGNIVSKEELLGYLQQFYLENGRVPESRDFSNNSNFPNFHIYINYFGAWNTAIELAGLEKRKNRYPLKYSDEELLEYLKKFYEENGRPPTARNFANNLRYPGYNTYQKRFGSFEKAKRLVGLNTDSMVMKGILETGKQKARLSEILVIKHFVNKEAIDLSGENCNSPIDGICPEGQTYDVKSSKLYIRYVEEYWRFDLDKVVDYYYLLAFNKDWTELLYVWRIPGDFTKDHYLNISVNGFRGAYCINDLKEYEITDNFKKIEILKESI